MEKEIIIKGKYKLVYSGSELFVYGVAKMVFTIERVDGIRAGTMNTVAVGVNENYILFKGSNSRVNSKSAFWVLRNKKTGEEKVSYDRPLGQRFTKIKGELA